MKSYNEIGGINLENTSILEGIRQIPDSRKILYVIDKAINSHNYEFIGRLQIVKLLYMLDVYFKEKTSERFTNYEYQKWHHGPFTWDIVNEAEKLEEEGFLFHPNSYYLYTLIRVPEKFEEIKNKIDKSIRELGLEQKIQSLFELGRDKNEILRFVENREEVKKTKFSEKIEI
jgi:hypothetical protein